MCWSDLHKLDLNSTEVQWVLGMRNSFVLSTSATADRIAAFINQPNSQQASCFSIPIPESHRPFLTDDSTLLQLYALAIALKGLRPIFKNRPLLLVTNSIAIKEEILSQCEGNPPTNQIYCKPLQMITQILLESKLKIATVDQMEGSVAHCLSRLPETQYRDKFRVVSKNLYMDVVDIDERLLETFDVAVSA